MQWLNSKLASQLKLAESEAGSSDQLENQQSSTFRENILLSHEEKMILDSVGYFFFPTKFLIFFVKGNMLEYSHSFFLFFLVQFVWLIV